MYMPSKYKNTQKGKKKTIKGKPGIHKLQITFQSKSNDQIKPNTQNKGAHSKSKKIQIKTRGKPPGRNLAFR
ncbi:hypothetical protein HYALB_00003129 [Hymenoscyphus albidus]|uniref:Uncharacterized protein n=1 Tax=Hymenoscyphus albidus TaxID=595503 RepID=A0A9N9LHI8_9HELO|nr:hypothetical protein HYALB_00003129 [Hymenoscyphus albidus]